MAAGVIDIGSNSIKLLIGEPSNGDIMILESLKNVVPIGRSTFLKGQISQEPIILTINILEKYIVFQFLPKYFLCVELGQLSGQATQTGTVRRAPSACSSAATICRGQKRVFPSTC